MHNLIPFIFTSFISFDALKCFPYPYTYLEMFEESCVGMCSDKLKYPFFFSASIQIVAAEIIHLTSTFKCVTLPLHPPLPLYFLPCLAKTSCHLFQNLSQTILSLHTSCPSPMQNSGSHSHLCIVIMSASIIQSSYCFLS